MNKQPLKILMVDSHAEIERGGAIQCARLASILAERGHDVTCIFDEGITGPKREGAEWLRMEKAGVRIWRRRLLKPLAMRRFKRTLDELKPDIVHTHKNRALGFVAGASLNRRSFGWVANRGTEYSLFREPPAWAIHRFCVDRIIPVADAVMEQLIRDGIPAQRVRTVYGSFDQDRFNPATDGQAMRDVWNIPSGAPLIGMAASFRSRKKGHCDLIEVAAQLLRERPDAFFVLAGDGSSERAKAMATKLGIADRVRFPGFVSDMPAAFAAMDVVVCASRRGEGLTGSVREALAMARPVISTDVAGNRELIRHGDTGLLVPVRDPGSLSRAIHRLLSNPDEAAKLGKAGRTLVLELCSDDARASKVEQVYRELLAERLAIAR